MGNLRQVGFAREEGTGKSAIVYITEDGLDHLGADILDTPTTHEEVMALWKNALRSGAYRILEKVVEAGAEGIHRDDLAYAVDMEVSGGTFNTYLGNLRQNSLVIEANKISVANDILFPERV